MAIKFTNNASTSLAGSITASSTAIVVATGGGVAFPVLSAGDYFYATLTDPSNNIEIVKVTARSGDVFTVVRGQDGTTARSFAVGNKFELRVTAAALDDILNFALLNGGTMTGPLIVQSTVTLGGANNAFYWNDRADSNKKFLAYVDTEVWEMYRDFNGTVFKVLSSDGAGNLTVGGDVISNSDERLKTNWQLLPEDFVERLAGVKCGSYDRIDTGAVQVGVSAQSLELVLPQAVNSDANGLLSVAYGNAALVSCIKLAQKVVELEQKIKDLENKE